MKRTARSLANISRILATSTAVALFAAFSPPSAAHGATEDRGAVLEPTQHVDFTVDGLLADTNPADAWKGFGALSCNNTSRLLLDYKEDHPEQYWEIMNALFDPKRGMGLSHVKVEMGSDANTSSGTEPATKRGEDDPANVVRGAGFHFAADAKSINPDVEVSLLRWSYPAWVNDEKDSAKKFEKAYQWYKQTIDAAYDTYGLVVDGVSPNQNETGANVDWITYFGRRLIEDSQKPGETRYDYSQLQIASSDEIGKRDMANPAISLYTADTLKADYGYTDETLSSVAEPAGDIAAARQEALDPANNGKLWHVYYPRYHNEEYYYSFGRIDKPGDSDKQKESNKKARDKALAYFDIVDILTHHYSSIASPEMAILNRTYGDQIWYSEGVSNTGYGRSVQKLGIAPAGEASLDVMNLFINSFANTDPANDAVESNGYPNGVPDAHHSLYIYQPAIGAFFQGGTFSGKSMVGAYEPWSGWWEKDLGSFTTRHFTNFARIGTKPHDDAGQKASAGRTDLTHAWQPIEGGATLGGGHQSWHSIVDSYSGRMTLAAPDRSDFSTVLTNNSPETVAYRIGLKNLDLAKGNHGAAQKTLADFETVQVTDATGDRDSAVFDDQWFQRRDDLKIRGSGDDRYVELTVKPFSMRTITSLDGDDLPASHVPGENTSDGSDRKVLDRRQNPDDALIYSDDFQYADRRDEQIRWDYSTYTPDHALTQSGSQPAGPQYSYQDRRGGQSKYGGFAPAYSTDMGGAFEVSADADSNNALTQQLGYDQKPGTWTSGGNSWPSTLIGDDKWANYEVGVDATFDLTSPSNPNPPAGQEGRWTNYLGLSGRNNQEGNGYELLVNKTGSWGLAVGQGDGRDLGGDPAHSDATLVGGRIKDFDPATKHHLALRFADSLITVVIDGKTVGSYVDPSHRRMSGRVGLISGWFHSRFDNLTVRTVNGYAPFVSEYIENGDARIHYQGGIADKNLPEQPEGTWEASFLGASYLYRTASTGTKGAVVRFPFTGTGFVIEGAGSQASITVNIDGKVVDQGASAVGVGGRGANYVLSGLKNGKHRATITVLDGAFEIDSIAPYTQIWGSKSAQHLADELNQLMFDAKAAPLQSDYTPASWDAYVKSFEAARKVAADAAAGQAEIDKALAALVTDYAALAPLETLGTEVAAFYGAHFLSAGDELPPLPSSVSVRNAAGVVEQVPVTWDTSAADADARGKAFNTFSVVATVDGHPELGGTTTFTVLPADVIPERFGYFIDAGREGADSAMFNVATKSATLRNATPDQAYVEGSTSWGYINAKGGEAGDANSWGESYWFDAGTGDDTALGYRLTLDPGTYTLSAGYSTRRSVPTKSWIDLGDGKQTDLKTFTASTNESTVVTHTFTLAEKKTVAFRTTKTSGGYNVALGWLYVGDLTGIDTGNAPELAKARELAAADTVIASGRYFRDDAFDAYVSARDTLATSTGDDIPAAISQLTTAEAALSSVDASALRNEWKVAHVTAERVAAGLFQDAGQAEFATALKNVDDLVKDPAASTQATLNAATNALHDARRALTPIELSAVVADPAGGTYLTAQSVQLSTGTTGAPEILYTTNGSPPQALSRQYTSPIDILDDTTITARAFKVGLKPGPLSVFRYVID